MTLTQAAQRAGISPGALAARLNSGMEIEKALSESTDTRWNKLLDTPRGPLSINQIADLTGCRPNTIARRVAAGKSWDRVFQSGYDATLRAYGRVQTPWGLLSLRELEAQTGAKYGTLRQRLAKGVTGPALWSSDRCTTS